MFVFLHTQYHLVFESFVINRFSNFFFFFSLQILYLLLLVEMNVLVLKINVSCIQLWTRKKKWGGGGGSIGLFITLVFKVFNNVFLFIGLKTFEEEVILYNIIGDLHNLTAIVSSLYIPDIPRCMEIKLFFLTHLPVTWFSS